MSTATESEKGIRNGTPPRFDKNRVKEAALGQGHAILAKLGESADLLDGKYHPCPICGKTTFICKDQNEGGFCCQNSNCKPQGLGDWFALVGWLKDLKFVDAVAFVADAINFSEKSNYKKQAKPKLPTGEDKKPTSPAFKKTFIEQPGGNNLFPFFSNNKPPIKPGGLERAGAKMGYAQCHPETQQMHVLAVPCYAADSLEQIDLVLYHHSGKQELPVGNGEYRKTRMLDGRTGILLSTWGIQALRAGKAVPELRVLKVEGASDFLAMLSMIDEQSENILVFSNSAGATEVKTASPFSKRLATIKPSSVHCIGDCDIAGQAGLLGGKTKHGNIPIGWAQILANETGRDCHVHKLPYEITDSHGKDLRDWLNDGNKASEVLLLPAGNVISPESPDDRIAKLMEKHHVPRTLTTQELFDQSDEDTFLIEDTLVANQPAIVAGPSKAMKTTISIDAAISLATGSPFLGRNVPEAVPVLFLTSEIGRSQVRKLAYRIAKTKAENGVQMQLYESNNLHWNTWVPYIPDPEQLEILEAEIKRVGARAVFCDPLYLMLDGDTAASYSLNAQQLRALCSMCLEAGATPICNDHAKRSSSNAKDHEPLELDDISGAGKAEYFRQWLLVSRRERFDEAEPHKLWLSIGGSAFAGSTLAVDIDERSDETGKRTYAISSQPASELRKAKIKQRSDSRAEAESKRIAQKADELIEKVFKGDHTLSLSKNDIEDRLGLRTKEAGKVIGHLINEDRLKHVPGSLVKNSRRFDGYMLPGLNLIESEKF